MNRAGRLVPFVLTLAAMVFALQRSAMGQQAAAMARDAEAMVRSVEQRRGIGGHPETPGSINSGKCGLAMWFTVQEHWNDYSEPQKQRLVAAFAEPSRQKNRVIGHFRIYYDTAGINAPAMLDPSFVPIDGTVEEYVDSVGACFNRAWTLEIDILGYAPPPLPQDGKHPVYITELGYPFYGLTTPSSSPINQSGPPRYMTYNEVDNDFSGFWYGTSQGLPGLRVTCAHEFHHSIQLGAYGAWWNAIFFYEITSTWMEDVVYPEVHDYYQYLSSDSLQSSQFSHPERRFSLLDGSIEYSRVVWAKYLEKRFSRSLMHRTWDYLRAVPPVQALDNALSDVGSSFRAAFLEFAYWNFFTGIHADTTKYYTEGAHYPAMRQRPERDYVPPELVFDDALEAVSSLYQSIRVNGGEMLTIISNIDTAAGNSPMPFGFSYSLASTPSPGAKHLSNGLFSRIMNVPDVASWATQDTIPTIVGDVVAYPNPFVPKGNKPLRFHLPQTNQSSATVTILTSSLSRFYSGDLPIRPFEPVVEWNGHDAQHHVIPSGIYFFFITVGDRQYVGKFAVTR